LLGLFVVAALLVGCGGAAGQASSSNTNGPASYAPDKHSAASGSSGGGTSTGAGQGTPSAPGGPLYLIKTLDVNMAVTDTRKTATDLQAWIVGTDPRAISAGLDYEQVGDNQYAVTLRYSVQATLYPQIEQYLAGYAQQHDGKLLNLRETVQDVTNDYIDTQSRLTNLRAEQQRLLELLKQSSSLSDTLAIEQRLTDVEGQIESIEAHLNALNGQVTYYTVTITLQPISTVPAASNNGWNPGQTLGDALHAALIFAELLGTLLIWALVFSIFALPAYIAWRLIRRRIRSR
jgi:hypothetical protein